MNSANRNDTLAVLLPVYNRPTLALRTLDSVMAQSRLPEMLVIVDDGSTDLSYDVLKNWVRAQSLAVTIRLERIEHAGVSRARNRALSLSEESTLVAFLDSDDVWPPDFLARTRNLISADFDIAAVSADQLFEPADGNVSLRDTSGISTPWLLLHGAGVGSATLFRKDIVMRAGGFDENIISGADFKLFLDVSLMGRWLHASGAPVQMLRGYRVHGSDAGNLSLSRPDNWAAWARIASQFVVRHAGNTGLSDERLLQMIARRWHDAARNLAARQRYQDACAAYEAALRPSDYLNSIRSTAAGQPIDRTGGIA